MDGDLPSYPTIPPPPSTSVPQPIIFRGGYTGPTHAPMVPTAMNILPSLRGDMPPSSILPPVPISPAMGISPHSSLLPTQPVSSTGLPSQQIEEPIYSTVVKPPKQPVSLMGIVPPSGGAHPSTQSLPLTTSNLLLRIQYLESLCVNFQKEKKAAEDVMRVKEEEFGRQRKKFMNQMMEKEAEVVLARQTVEKFSNEVQELSTQLLQRDEEMKNIGMAVQLTDASSREAFDVDRVKYEEEIASLQKILKEQTLDSAQDLKEVKEAWQREKHALERQIGQLRTWLGLAPKLNQHDPQDSLETSMFKATEDTKLLRSVVLPLEEDIEKLKRQLREAEESLRAYGEQPGDSTFPLIDLDDSTVTSPGRPDNRDLLTSSPTEPLQLQQQLDLERSARHDLEMHIQQLKRQKALLQEEFTELKEQVEKVRTDYDKERSAHADLKKTWELANQHFIVAQDQLKQQIYNLEQRVAFSEESPVNTGDGTADGDGGIVIKVEEVSGIRKAHSSENMDILCSPTTTTSAVRSASWSNSLSQVQAPPSSLEERVASMEAELSQLHRELSRRVQMCGNYESQLQRVQEQMVADMDEKERSMDRLRAECEKYKAAIMRERSLRSELRLQMSQAKEEMTARIEAFSTNEHELSQVQKSLRDCFMEAKHDAQREVARFSDDRVKLYGHIEHSREEYECLKVLQSQQMEDYQQKLVEMDQARQEAESKYSQTMEELTSFRVRMAEVEDDLCNQVAALKEQLLSEQSHKDKLETSLTQQLIETRIEMVELQGLKDEAGRERTAKEEALASRSSIQEKSKSFIEGQQKQLERLSLEKESAEQHVRDLQRQVSSLRSQLNHTEATQKDFVQLSQTLQVRIAAMEEQQSEEQQQQRRNSSEDTPT